MQGMIVRWVLNAIALLITAALFPGIQITDFFSALVAAVVLGVVNAVIRPIVLFLTLPLNLLTLGLFTFFINGFMLKIVDNVVVGVSIQGFWTFVFGALVLSIISGILSSLVEGQ
ncbi:phage holin family protein [Dehalobacterium formicoaceticum]|uniref:Phage holin family protein n=1 Tax=Dehalobacterium formicoaceticum TaxID=51515 RepID=A0ABT1Y508_9FIRM|nr:phage holin family protein [Dehalobacterium formicoaceticum]MCR6545596.1 phage holin family protein [Dehalobacterium formicoaceticum]